MKIQDIIEALPELSKVDLKTVRDTASFLLGGDSGKEGVHQSDDTLFNAMANQLSKNGLRTEFNYNTFKKSKSHVGWATTRKELADFVSRCFGNISKTEEVSLYNLLFDLLITDLKKRGAPLTVSVLAINANRLPEVFERSFPGYISSGLAHVVLKTMEGKQNG
jgi:hypothetical protein